MQTHTDTHSLTHLLIWLCRGRGMYFSIVTPAAFLVIQSADSTLSICFGKHLPTMKDEVQFEIKISIGYFSGISFLNLHGFILFEYERHLKKIFTRSHCWKNLFCFLFNNTMYIFYFIIKFQKQTINKYREEQSILNLKNGVVSNKYVE